MTPYQKQQLETAQKEWNAAKKQPYLWGTTANVLSNSFTEVIEGRATIQQLEDVLLERVNALSGVMSISAYYERALNEVKIIIAGGNINP